MDINFEILPLVSLKHIVVASHESFCKNLVDYFRQAALERLLERVPVKAVIYEDNRQNIWKTLAKTHGLTQLPIKIAPQTPAGCWQFADIEKTSQTQEVVGSLADDTGILVRTSGTTAEAKIVAWSQASFLLSVGVAAKWMGLTSSDRSLCVMPFSYLHSLLRSCLPGLLEGGSVVCCPGFDRLQILQWLETFQPRISHKICDRQTQKPYRKWV
ncbi:similar to Acyl-CoA synthetases (AMP-forming)/AMP-acid ligases II [Crocosphaera watsonii WH 8501]|uniref:Similar to Acyl-CoA synthetases (AMP-forming)/AMP-acid ligases II n=1 Tax=Crocosphaera watsonii WH 8501 TaxID=165597 RepID=Q4C3W4_CROWT|nr:similar to Acyl-CoA synthetases (AMP-forming)/AMP-acid ligases II [Crocosphaera watsonii WH 8501]